MRGGQSLNIVPDRAEILFEFRTVSADDPDALVAEVAAFARTKLEPEMKAIAPEAGFDFDVYAGFPGLATEASAPIVTLAKNLAGRNDHAKVAYGTEAGLFDVMAGIPSVVLGPGSIAQAHKADEYIELSELSRCLGFIERLAERCRA
jgi:acetylornithine deacetylase